MRTRRTIRVAVIGTGFMGQLYARICAQMQGVEVIAVCDLTPERAVPLAGELAAAVYPSGDYKLMLKEHSEIDAVLVCTREDSHRGPAVAALEANKHLLVEKPLATAVDDARAIVEAAHGRPGAITMITYTLRFDPRYIEMKRAIARKDIGEITHIYARRTPPHAALERIGGRVELPFWVGVHDIDMMRWVISSEVAKVFAVSAQNVQEYPSVKGVFLSLLTFKNGVVAALENAWAPPYSSQGQQSTAVFRVQGSRGTVEAKNFDQSVVIYTRNGTAYPDTVSIRDSYGHIAGVYAEQIAYFIKCIREGQSPEMRLEDGLAGVQIAEAILTSASSGKEVVMSQKCSPVTRPLAPEL